MDLCTNSVAMSGDKIMQAESADGSFDVRPVTSESASRGTLSVGLDQELYPNQLEYLLIDTGARAGQISKVDLVWPSGLNGMDPSQASFFQLLRTGTKMVGPGVSEVVSYLAAFALTDGASVFIVSGTGAATMRPTGGVALVSEAILSAVRWQFRRTDRGRLVS